MSILIILLWILGVVIAIGGFIYSKENPIVFAFLSWFIISLIGYFFILSIISNPFTLSFIFSLILSFVAIKNA